MPIRGCMAAYDPEADASIGEGSGDARRRGRPPRSRKLLHYGPSANVRHMRGRGGRVRRLPVRGGGRDGDHHEAENHGPEREPVGPGGHPRGRRRAPAARRRDGLTLDLDRPPLPVARERVDVSDALLPGRRVLVSQWSLASQRAAQ
jgi:hypothetical protein